MENFTIFVDYFKTMRKIILLIYMLGYVIPVMASHYYYKQIFLEEGLPSTVKSVLRDERGFVWIGTNEGIERFDGYELRTYTHINSNPNSLPHTIITGIIEDRQCNLWAITEKGVARYEKKNDTFLTIKDSLNNNITTYSACVYEDGIIFGGKGRLYKYNYKTQSFSQCLLFNQLQNFIVTDIKYWDKETVLCSSRWNGIILVNTRTGEISSSPFASEHNIISIFRDSRKRIWIASYNKGITCYSPTGKLITSYTVHNSQLSSNIVLCIEECNNLIWVGTDGGGINIINPETQEIKVLKHMPGDNSSLPVNSILNLHNDGNTLWAGTIRGGLIAIKEVFMRTYTSVLLGTDRGLSDNTILGLYEDGPNTIWIGTDGGGINKFDITTNKFKHLIHTWEKKVSSITGFDDNYLLFSCFNTGSFLLDKKTETYHPFIIVNDSINKYLYHRGKSVNVYQNSPESILILTDFLYHYNIKTHSFREIKVDKTNPIYGILLPICKNANFTYLNDMKTIYAFNSHTHRITPLHSFDFDTDTIINSVSQDKNGIFWIGTSRGLCSYDSQNNTCISYPTSLFTNAISVVCDLRGRVWIASTENMLFSWSIEEKKFIIYSESDGLSLNEYMNEPRLVSSQGDIYMGGAKGLLRIDRHFPTDTIESYQLQLANISLNGEPINNKLKGNPPFLSIPWDSKALTIKVLSHEKDIFRKRIYRYKIQGSNNQRIDSYSPEFTLHSFVPGTYSIFVSCNTKNGDWTPDEPILTFQITPPWYRAWWFIFLCVLVISAAIAASVHITLRRKENKLKWAMKEHEQQVYEEKVRFLINISHELRTPLTLIHAPLKRLLQSIPDADKNFLPLKGIYNQAQRMRNLINMVLDVRKMEVGQSNLLLKPHFLNKWIHLIANDFEMEVTARNIKISYALDEEIGEISFDENKCEIVLTNILSNALKYSPDCTEIRIISQLDRENQKVRISVIDQGCGLKNIDPTKLFTRFYRGNTEQAGSGIGLSYAKMLVELHGGKMGANDNAGTQGATFFFELPLKTITEKTPCEAKPYLNELIHTDGEEKTISITQYPTHNYSLLLADDNKDLIAFLKESLHSQFKRIYTASNGIEANEITQKEHPDIVVSDIMMPQMDGYNLCKSIKENIETSHIPVILLTARDDDKSRLYGYKNGADAYIAKPFDLEILLEQIRSILYNRESIRQRYLHTGVIPMPEETTFSNADEEFLLRLNKMIDNNLDNPELDVLFLCKEIGMSRSSLYNKLKILTSMGVNDYINKIRMEKALSFISSNPEMSITEIAENLGFSTLRYFSTTFKQYTGKTPSAYKQDLKKVQK